jgi:IS5 family transposase
MVRALKLLNNGNFTHKSSRSDSMRKPYDRQQRFDCSPIAEVVLDLECRDEIIPILAGLRYLYLDAKLRRKVVKLVAADLNKESRRDVGRPGMDDWQVVVLAAVRLGCNYDYDKLQDLVNNHRSLRGIMGIGDWQDPSSMTYRRIRDTLCLLRPETIERINQAIVQAGRALAPEAATCVRADSFVCETNIHYPTESSLILDGIRKFVPLCVELSGQLDVSGWRQAAHLSKKIRRLVQNIGRVSASKESGKKEALRALYSDLLERTGQLIERAKSLVKTAKERATTTEQLALSVAIQHWIGLTGQVCDTATRRVIHGESVPNSEKLFSLFETHTQLYRRGKAATPNQFGRMVLLFEDGAGFISHYHLMNRNARDADVIVEQTRKTQRKHQWQIKRASFDRGFYSPKNAEDLSHIVDVVCLPPRHPKQYADQMAKASVDFRNARQRHSGIEAAIGVMQRGNGMKRCRDRTELGFERYLGLAVLGRNIHVLGKMVIARREADSLSAISFRAAA